MPRYRTCLLQLLLENGADPHYTNGDISALWCALHGGYNDHTNLRFLVEQVGLDANKRYGEEGHTLLMQVAGLPFGPSRELMEVLRSFIRCGLADPTLRDASGKTALDIASEGGDGGPNEKMIEVLEPFM